MERKKIQNTPDAILTADWHLRETNPVARLDNFETAQWGKIDFIDKLQKKYNCPIIHAGDLFDYWKPSPYLLSKTIELLPDKFYTIYGNHDLPQHNLDLAGKCGIHNIEVAGKLTVLPGTHWEQEIQDASYIIKDKKILVYHVMSYQGKLPWPGCTDPSSASLIRKLKDFDLILTGHNHQAFVEEYNGRLLVNPGSITRQTAAQIDFKPRVYLYYAKSNTVEPIYLPIDTAVISKEHIDIKKKRDDRIDAFIDGLDGNLGDSLDFEKNLQIFFQKNKVDKEITKLIENAINK